MSSTLQRQRDADFNASDRAREEINWMFYGTEMETWLEVFQWKDYFCLVFFFFFCKMLTVVNCLENTLAFNNKKSTEGKKMEMQF